MKLALGLVASRSPRLAVPNTTAILAVIISAVSVAAAVLLLRELGRPFAGLIWDSSAPILGSLSQLGK